MKRLNWNRMAVLTVLMASASLALAAQVTLKVGDSAPKLRTGKWVQGDPVTGFEKGKAYIVEFWATWCPPCRATIPHLNEIHTKYKDKGLIVIGQDCAEDERLVQSFVKKMGDKMTYRVALDDMTSSKAGAMAETWMAAAGLKGIPGAFLVDTAGKIAWIGHPMALEEKVIEEVLAGKYDLHKAAEAATAQEESQARLQTTSKELNQAMNQKNWQQAIAKLAELEKLVPGQQRDRLDETRFIILLGKEDYPAAYKVAARLSERFQTEASFQNELAWRILTQPDIKQRDLPLAETIARRGNESAKEKDANILDTLARALFMQGKKEEAITTQEKALTLVDDDQKAGFQSTLDSYKKGKLPAAD